MIQNITAFLLLYLSTFTTTVTAYSPANVDPRWQGQARWTGQPPIIGISAACPPEWANEWIHVQGYGFRRCDDTPRYGWYTDEQGNVTAHVDLYLGSQEEALRHGVQRLIVWKERN